MSKQMNYTEDFKKNIVALYQNGKTYAQIQKEFGVGYTAVSNWVRKYATRSEDGKILSLEEVSLLRKRLAALEEENIILKKAMGIFMQESSKK